MMKRNGRLKHLIIGGGLAGCGYALIGGAPRVSNASLVGVLFAVGLIAFISGIAILVIAWRSRKGDQNEEEPKSATEV